MKYHYVGWKLVRKDTNEAKMVMDENARDRNIL